MKKKPPKKPKKTAEELFLEAWNEFGYAGSDLVREYRFYPLRRWRFDFAFPSRYVAVEIDGRGRHQTVIGVRRDAEKCNTATEIGWDVLHFPATDLRAKNEHGEPLLELFIDQLCRILSHRSTISEQGKLHKKVEVMREMSSPLERQPPRNLPGKHPSRRSVGGGGSGKD